MLNAIVSRVALEMLVRSISEEDSEFRRLFWDYMYLYRYGLTEFKDPVPVLSGLWQEPTPTPMLERLRLHEEVLIGLIDIAAGDPSPQPSIQAVLHDREARLEAAKGLAQRLDSGLEQVNKEIERLAETPPQ